MYISVINVWTTEPKRRLSQQSRSSLPPMGSTVVNSNSLPSITVQKFGNQKTTISDVGLGAHEGKYTPSSSVPDLATRLLFTHSLLYWKTYLSNLRFANLSVINSDGSNGLNIQNSQAHHLYTNQHITSSYIIDNSAVKIESNINLFSKNDLICRF